MFDEKIKFISLNIYIPNTDTIAYSTFVKEFDLELLLDKLSKLGRAIKFVDNDPVNSLSIYCDGLELAYVSFDN